MDPSLPGTVQPTHWASISALLEGLPEAAWLVSVDQFRVVAANAAAQQLLGRLPVGEEAQALLATPEDFAFWTELEAGTRPASLQSEMDLQAADGRHLHLLRSIRAVSLGPQDSAPGHYLVSLSDRSAAQAAEQAQEQAVAELQATLESTADGLLVVDLLGRIRACNRRFVQLWDVPEALLAEKRDEAVHDWLRMSVREPQAYARRLASLQGAALAQAEDRLELLNGQVLERVLRPLWVRGRPLGRVFAFRDLTPQLRAQERIHTLARTDALTRLPNRATLVERMRGPGLSEAGLLVVDLDHFGHINDGFGHAVGDEVLCEVAQRLQALTRADDMAARIGGDQFALWLEGADRSAAEAAATRALQAVAQPFRVADVPFTLTCSIGIALRPAHGAAPDELMAHAQTALDAAKAAGRANFRIQRGRRSGERRSEKALDHSMRQALASGRFRLHYQPQVTLADGRPCGAEALLRWRDPQLGEVAPARFIPVAEESGFIIAIGDWVLQQAVRQAAQWRERGLQVPVAVNVSALQFQQPGFVDRVARTLAEHALPAQALELELTESILVNGAQQAQRRLVALRELGVQLSIDDFGTGYSSLAYLKHLPVQKLKIDRSFVQGLPDEQRDAGLVRAILQMAQALDMVVIAEGVETEPQRAFLQASGCAQFQGYLYAAGMDALSFEQRWRQAMASFEATHRPRMHLVRA
jgi:diguanylate cyclase (GGDEF)-like protein